MGLDGLDIDWEYPKNQQEAADFVALLRECRETLDAYASGLEGKPHFELTVASPAGAQNYNNMDLRGMDQYLDFWNLMAYDYAGSWDSKAGHQANLFHSTRNPASTPFNTVQAVEHYKSQGVAASKIVLGMPLYGRAFENTTGPGQPYSGIGEGSWEAGAWDYKALPKDGAKEIEDHEAGASYSYDEGKKVMISYDTKSMVRNKAQWIKDNGLGGSMWWESSADKSGEESLIGNVVDVLGKLESTQNCLTYPDSKYENLKNGL